MNAIQRKIRAKSGVSIMAALLLFLVCAILCSVILAASTAAAGRMSKMAETDQRYYAVTSATELLKELLNGQKVSIVREGDKESLMLGDAVEKLSEPEEIKSAILSPVTDSLLNYASYYLYKGNSEGTYMSQTYAIKASVAPSDGKLAKNLGEGLDVTVEQKLDFSSGNLILIVSSGSSGSSGEQAFRQRLTFSSQVERLNRWNVEKKVDELYMVTYTWTLASVETL
jgi:hypothetical protein